MISTNPFDHIKGLEGPIILRKLASLCGIPIQQLQDDFYLNSSSSLPSLPSTSYLNYSPAPLTSSSPTSSSTPSNYHPSASFISKSDLDTLKSFLYNLCQDYFKEYHKVVEEKRENFDDFFILKYNKYFNNDNKIKKILEKFLKFYYNFDLKDELFSISENIFSSDQINSSDTSSSSMSCLYFETLQLKLKSLELKINSWNVLNNILVNSNDINFFYILFINNYYNIFLLQFFLIYLKLILKNNILLSNYTKMLKNERNFNDSYEEFDIKLMNFEKNNEEKNENLINLKKDLLNFSFFQENSSFLSIFSTLSLSYSIISNTNLVENPNFSSNFSLNSSLLSLYLFNNDNHYSIFYQLRNFYLLSLTNYNQIFLWYEKKRLNYYQKCQTFDYEIHSIQRKLVSSSTSPNPSSFSSNSFDTQDTISSTNSSTKDTLKNLLFDYILFNEAYGNINRIISISKSLYEIITNIKNNIELYLKLVLVSLSLHNYTNLSNYLAKLIKLTNDKKIINHFNIFFFLANSNNDSTSLNLSKIQTNSNFESVFYNFSSLQEYILNYNLDLDNSSDNNIFDENDIKLGNTSSITSNYYHFSSFTTNNTSLMNNPYISTNLNSVLTNFLYFNEDILSSFVKKYLFSNEISTIYNLSSYTSTTTIDFEKEIKCGLPYVINSLDTSYSFLIMALSYFKSPHEYSHHLFTTSNDNHSLIFGSNKLNLFNVILNQHNCSSITSKLNKNILIDFIEEIYYKNKYKKFFLLINYIKISLNLNLYLFNKQKIILNLLINNLFYLFLQPFSSVSFNYIEEKFLPYTESDNFSKVNELIINKVEENDIKLVNNLKKKLFTNKKNSNYKQIIVDSLIELLLKKKIDGKIDMKNKIFAANFVHPSSTSIEKSNYLSIKSNLINLLNKQEHFYSRGLFVSSFLLAVANKKFEDTTFSLSKNYISMNPTALSSLNMLKCGTGLNSNISSIIQIQNSIESNFDSDDSENNNMILG